MPNQGEGRGNYRVDPTGVLPAKGYGSGRYRKVRIVWDSSVDGDPGFAEVEYDGEPITHGDLAALIEGLNSGRIRDRWT